METSSGLTVGKSTGATARICFCRKFLRFNFGGTIKGFLWKEFYGQSSWFVLSLNVLPKNQRERKYWNLKKKKQKLQALNLPIIAYFQKPTFIPDSTNSLFSLTKALKKERKKKLQNYVPLIMFVRSLALSLSHLRHAPCTNFKMLRTLKPVKTRR